MTVSSIQDVVCVVGVTKDNKPVWKKVGVKILTKTSNKEVILLDRTFNPAGVAVDYNNKNSIALYFFEQREAEKGREEPTTSPKTKQSNQRSYLDDLKDDMPF